MSGASARRSGRRQMQAKGASSPRGRSRQSRGGGRGAGPTGSVTAGKRSGGRSAPPRSRGAAIRRRTAERRAAARPSRRARVLQLVPRAGQSRSPKRPSARRPFRRGASGALLRSPRWTRRRQEGRAQGVLNVAGALLARRGQLQSKKRPAALAVAAAGAAGVALAKRRRAAAANEPPAGTFPSGDETIGSERAMAEHPADDAATAPAPDAEETPAG